MLRKLVRDRNCHPVLRGILESLLHYITQDLPKLSTRDRSMEKAGSGIVAQRNTRNKDCPDERTDSSMKQTQLETNCTLVELHEEFKMNQGKVVGNSSKFPEEGKPDPQQGRLPSNHGGGKKAGELIPRRLTTFQLLQSKFTRSTPKPSISHQREVGTLPFSRGAAGNVNLSQHSEQDMPKRDRVKREHGLKKVGNVKDMVAKFAMAEKKEQELNKLKQQPTKPRLIGRGILLSSLMERFETIASVCKGSDLKSSGGVKVTTDIKEKLECHDRGKQQLVDQTVHKQNQHMPVTKKSIPQQLKRNQIMIGQEQRPEQVVDMLTKVNSNQKDTKNLKSEEKGQMREQPSDKKADSDCSSKQIKGGNRKGWQLGKHDEIQTTVDECHYITNRLKYGHLEMVCLTFVTEWSFPDSYRLFPQVEALLSWHMATITTCSPVFHTAVDASPKQFLQKVKPVTSENIDTISLKKDHPHIAPQYSQRRDGDVVELPTIVEGAIGNTLKPNIEEIFEDRSDDPTGNSDFKPVTSENIKTINLKKDHPHIAPQYSQRRDQDADEPPTIVEGAIGNTLKPNTEEIFEDRSDDPMGNGTIENQNPLKAITLQRRSPKYVIPRVYRFDHQQGADHTDSASQSTLHPETITPSPSSPPSKSDSSMSALNPVLLRVENLLDLDPYPPNDVTLHTIIHRKPAEAKTQEKHSEAKEEKEVAQVDIKDNNMQRCLGLSEDTTSETGLEDSKTSAVTLVENQPEREKPKQKPKYTTINYGDPSVKQTYKPKIIRFTDTFTF